MSTWVSCHGVTKVKPLVSEFGSYKTWIFQPSHNIDDIDVVLKSLPKGTRIVNRKLVSWGDVRVCKWDGTSLTDESEKMEADKVEKITFGVPREPSDFVAEAVKAGHPRFLEYRAFEAIDNLVGANLCSDTYKVIRRRLDFLSKWTARAAELEKDEKALHQKLDPHWSAVLKGKRLLVFGEMLKQIGYPDYSFDFRHMPGLSYHRLGSRFGLLCSSAQAAINDFETFAGYDEGT